MPCALIEHNVGILGSLPEFLLFYVCQMSALESIMETQSTGRIKLSVASYVILGLARLGIDSGYAIKKIADLSTQAFWSISLSQVYPELRRLEGAGLLARSNDPQGGRTRSPYEITETGELAFLAWLRSAGSAPFQLRDEGMLRLLFADAISRKEQIELLWRMCEEDRRKSSQMRKISQLAALTEFEGARFPFVAARCTADGFDFAAGWLARLAMQFDADYSHASHRLDPVGSTDAALATSSRTPIKLTPTSFLILGMVRLTVRTGYAIKKWADISTQAFWPTSFGQLYRELSRLEGAGLLTKRSHSASARARTTYAITSAGASALRTWLRSSRTAPPRFRYEGLLRLFFADALPVSDRLQLVRRLRDDQRDMSVYIQNEIIPIGLSIEAHGIRCLPAVARLGRDRFALGAHWLTRLEVQLEADMQVSRG